MMKLLQICILLLFLAACEEKQLPRGVLNEAKFQDVLVDVMVAEAYFNTNRITTADSAAYIQAFYEHIFKTHEVSREEFYTTMEYYLKDPALFHDQLQPVIDSLSTIEANTRQ